MHIAYKEVKSIIFSFTQKNTGGRFRIYLNKIVFCDTFNINCLQGKLLKFKGDNLPERENIHFTHKIHTKSFPQLQF